MKPKIALGPLIIGCHSIDRQIPFYENVFGLEILRRSENYLKGMIGGAVVELEEDSEHRFPNWAKNNIGTYKCVEWYTDNLENFLHQVERHGGQILSPIKIQPWGDRTAEIVDLDNNIFLVCEK